MTKKWSPKSSSSVVFAHLFLPFVFAPSSSKYSYLKATLVDKEEQSGK
jgi:hypothetical protein